MTTSKSIDLAKFRSSVLIKFLKVDLIDPKPFGFDSNEISTETENFTVLGVGV